MKWLRSGLSALRNRCNNPEVFDEILVSIDVHFTILKEKTMSETQTTLSDPFKTRKEAEMFMQSEILKAFGIKEVVVGLHEGVTAVTGRHAVTGRLLTLKIS